LYLGRPASVKNKGALDHRAGVVHHSNRGVYMLRVDLQRGPKIHLSTVFTGRSDGVHEITTGSRRSALWNSISDLL
jgi:hypothetical protein